MCECVVVCAGVCRWIVYTYSAVKQTRVSRVLVSPKPWNSQHVDSPTTYYSTIGTVSLVAVVVVVVVVVVVAVVVVVVAVVLVPVIIIIIIVILIIYNNL